MDESTDQQVLMLAPADRAAVLASEVLASFGLLTRTCADIQTLCSELATASGAVLLTGETLTPDSVASLVDALKESLPGQIYRWWSSPQVVNAPKWAGACSSCWAHAPT
jgi:hypothetical protein